MKDLTKYARIEYPGDGYSESEVLALDGMDDETAVRNRLRAIGDASGVSEFKVTYEYKLTEPVV